MSIFIDTIPLFSLSVKTTGLNKIFLVAESDALLDTSAEVDSNSSCSLIVASAFFPFAHLESEEGLNKFLMNYFDEELIEELSKGIEDLYEAYKDLRMSDGQASSENHKKTLTRFEDSYSANSRKLEKILSHWEVYEYRYEFK